MDINGTPFLLLREPEDFDLGSTLVGWDRRRGALVLRQQQDLRLPRVGVDAGRAAWASASPLVQDPFGQLGRIGADGARIELDAGRGFEPLLDGRGSPVSAPAGRVLDLSMGGDGRLVAAYGNGAGSQGLILFHLARRWRTDLPLSAPAPRSGEPRRAIVDSANRVWCASRDGLFLCTGEPLPHPYSPMPGRFEPLEIEPHPFRVLWRLDLPEGRSALALCADRESLYLLVEDSVGAQSILTRPLDPDPGLRLSEWALDPDLPYLTDLAAMGGGALAALAPAEPGPGFERRDCPVLELVRHPETGVRSARALGERHPMRSLHTPRFCSAQDGLVRYQAEPEPGPESERRPGPRPRRLLPLPRPVYPTAVLVTPRLGQGGRGLDSGQPDSVWHRLYLDGCIPPGCRLTLLARAYNDPATRASIRYERQPAPLWSPLASELPGDPGLAPRRPGESGLFEILLQRETGAVRRLSGRFLQLRILFEGDGRQTPAIHALRIYGPRFSYQERYLPDLFRQTGQTGDQAGGPAGEGPANGADIRERLLSVFEGTLTPLEGRIAAAELLLHPDSAPESLLPGLAESLGLALPPHWPAGRRRRLLRQGCLVQQWRGTYPGLRLALDIATDGAVARGQVAVVEGFRLRRTMATILGIDMDDRDHPLTLGTGMSGNSLVGDSLILSDSDSRDFLALFAPDLAAGAEREQVEAFFDRHAHRVDVLLHGPARGLRHLVEETLAAELPAHLEHRILETDHPFVLGFAPLLAVDTYLEESPPPRPVALDDTYLGREGLLANPPALSPRDANARAAAPSHARSGG